MRKKAALNLSVEAIIIFVLAFAMLGVGIFVTDQLREIGVSGVETSQDILASIEESPTADKPLVGIKKSGVNLPANDQLELSLGYYNSMRSTATEATLIVDDCKSSSTGTVSSYSGDGEYPVNVVASTEDVSPSTSTGFLVVLNNNNLVSGETYICKLKVVQESDTTNEYDSLTFFLNVIS
ncbi:hypothetical protein COV16_05645 [Candidatus Woesearchaeota archaeon CG10_big_fil_rev_8_21_14_0_10_34_8]|nr:MAG: hypothetical protein COV16_05645 [Candidatus Woesearchaeota archaeon CG10_big_fil_rev_8_21_14_0_10_34_8]